MKKFLAILLSVMLVLSLSVFAFAGGDDPALGGGEGGGETPAANTYTITIDNAVNGETYTAYKIFDVLYNGTNANPGSTPAAPNPDNTHLKTGYAYTIPASSEWFGTVTNNHDTTNDTLGTTFTANGLKFTLTPAGNYSVEVDDQASPAFDAATFAALLNGAKAGKTAAGNATASGNSATINVNPDAPGYYFVDTSLGAFCSLDTTEPSAKIREKNTVPSIDKKESRTAGSYTDGPIDTNIGDTVYYEVVVTDGVGTDAAITVTDTMGAGLTYKAGTIAINGTVVADDANVANSYTVAVSGQTITITFAPAYVADLDENETITLTYQATVNSSAAIDTATSEANKNTVGLDYSAQHSEDSVNLSTYDFQVFKTDGTEFLDGAEFKLYDALTGGNQILLSSDATGYYVDPNGNANTTIDINASTGVNVRGLAPGTYYLEEVVTPTGYNTLATRQDVTVTTGQAAAVEITVVNNTGSELPSTGGIGTTIFYIVGAILVLGAGILIIAKRRSATAEQ